MAEPRHHTEGSHPQGEVLQPSCLQNHTWHALRRACKLYNTSQACESAAILILEAAFQAPSLCRSSWWGSSAHTWALRTCTLQFSTPSLLRGKDPAHSECNTLNRLVPPASAQIGSPQVTRETQKVCRTNETVENVTS